jgi:hypothetical protein
MMMMIIIADTLHQVPKAFLHYLGRNSLKDLMGQKIFRTKKLLT